MPAVNDLFIFVSMHMEGAIRVPRARFLAAAANLRIDRIARLAASFPVSHIRGRSANAVENIDVGRALARGPSG
jgi:hypothetical protein